MGIEQGNKRESDSLIRKCTDFQASNIRITALIHNKELMNIRDQTQLLAVLFMFNCISAILPRIDPQDHTPCT